MSSRITKGRPLEQKIWPNVFTDIFLCFWCSIVDSGSLYIRPPRAPWILLWTECSVLIELFISVDNLLLVPYQYNTYFLTSVLCVCNRHDIQFMAFVFLHPSESRHFEWNIFECSISNIRKAQSHLQFGFPLNENYYWYKFWKQNAQ